MTVLVNGTSIELSATASVTDAVHAAGHEGKAFGVAVALNGEVVPKGSWDSTMLAEADKVEVLVAAQGG
ncbi:MAG: sulfur carrier protein [Actinomycetota bacterium]|jgi:sulfur carrier protein|nr:sulfur carrier protein [Actinomycetota bacterium]